MRKKTGSERSTKLLKVTQLISYTTSTKPSLSTSEAQTPHGGGGVRGSKALVGVRQSPSHLWLRLLVSIFRFVQCPSLAVYFTPQRMQIKIWILISKQYPKLEFLWLRLQRILMCWRQGADSCVIRCENVCSTRVYLDLPAPHMLPPFNTLGNIWPDSRLRWPNCEFAPLRHKLLHRQARFIFPRSKM